MYVHYIGAQFSKLFYNPQMTWANSQFDLDFLINFYLC